MFSDEESEKPFEFKTWTPDITQKESRLKKLERVRLSAQNKLFSFAKPIQLNNPFVQKNNNDNDGIQEVTEEYLAAHRRVSSEDMRSTNKKLDKLRKLAKKNCLEALEPDSSKMLVSTEENSPERNSCYAVSTEVSRSYNPFESKVYQEDAANEDDVPQNQAGDKNFLGSSDDEDSQGDDEDDYVFATLKDGDQRRSIFYNNTVDEVTRLKEEFQTEDDEDIHFINGNFSEYFNEGDILGEGASGTVKRCVKITTDEVFAVKTVRYRGDSERLIMDLNEFRNHKKLNHKNIVKVYELYIDYVTKKTYTVMELAECGEMSEIIKELGHYTEAEASEIFKQILSGVNYLHQNGVCHRDLKPDNILVSRDRKIVKITDFNVSKFGNRSMTDDYTALSNGNYKMWTHTGTIAFTAPEVFTDLQYTEAVDMWSAGVVLYTMLCGYQPFDGENMQELTDQITGAKYEFHSDPWDKISQSAKDLIKGLLNVNFKTRFSPFQAIIHAWIFNQGKVVNTSVSGAIDNVWSYLNRGDLKELGQNDSQSESPNQDVIESGFTKRDLKTIMVYQNCPLIKRIQNLSPKKQSVIYNFSRPLKNDGSKTTLNKASPVQHKTSGFTSMLSLMKVTFSSSQINGASVESLMDSNKDIEASLSPTRGLTSCAHQEELPVFFHPSRSSIERGNIDTDSDLLIKFK